MLKLDKLVVNTIYYILIRKNISPLFFKLCNENLLQHYARSIEYDVRFMYMYIRRKGFRTFFTITPTSFSQPTTVSAGLVDSIVQVDIFTEILAIFPWLNILNIIKLLYYSLIQVYFLFLGLRAFSGGNFLCDIFRNPAVI